MKPLTANRIYLREFEYSDWVDVHAYASQDIVCRYQSWGPNTEQQTQAFVQQIIDDARRMPRTRYVFAMVEQGTGNMIGAGEMNIRSAADRSGEIAYIVHPDYWGKGFAMEAAGLFLEWGFDEYRLHRMYATCDPRNTGSAKVLSNIGMTQEGRLRDTMLLRDGWRDSLMFGMLEQERENRNA